MWCSNTQVATRTGGTVQKSDREIMEILEAFDLTRCPHSAADLAEEWGIHDYQGFGSFEVSEYEALAIVARIAIQCAVAVDARDDHTQHLCRPQAPLRGKDPLRV